MAKESKRVALVTGGNRGIGLEICRQLAARGLTVVLGARDRRDGEKAAKALGGGVAAVALDVTRDESAASSVKEILANHGRLDVLVNNAGILIDSGKTAMSVPLGDVEKTLETNVVGAWRMSQAAVPSMRKQRYGRIVNVSSSMGSFTDLADSGGGWPAYRLSKTSLNAMTALFASELRGDGILVNSCSPGWVRTDMGGAGAPRDVEEGADTPVWLALLPDEGPTGGYFFDRKMIEW